MTMNSNARWVGPFKLRDLLEKASDPNAIRPPPGAGAYLVTHREWSGEPDRAKPLYVGVSTQVRVRVGSMLADMLGFYNDKIGVGHHSGGRALHKWSHANKVSPFDLHLAWAENHDCHECLEADWHERLAPECNTAKPRCTAHPRTGR